MLFQESDGRANLAQLNLVLSPYRIQNMSLYKVYKGKSQLVLSGQNKHRLEKGLASLDRVPSARNPRP